MGKRSRNKRFRTDGANALKDAPIRTAALTVSPSNGGESSAAADFDPRLEYAADSQISNGILYQMLATSEAQYGTRAQSQTHMEAPNLLVW